jgi:hypothetical protein
LKEEQDWKGVLFGVHRNYEDVLDATPWVVTSADCFIVTHDSKESMDLNFSNSKEVNTKRLWAQITLIRKE